MAFTPGPSHRAWSAASRDAHSARAWVGTWKNGLSYPPGKSISMFIVKRRASTQDWNGPPRVRPAAAV